MKRAQSALQTKRRLAFARHLMMGNPTYIIYRPPAHQPWGFETLIIRERNSNSTGKDTEPWVLGEYIEEESGTYKRLSQGFKILNEQEYVDELKEIDKLEKVMDGENGLICKITKEEIVEVMN